MIDDIAVLGKRLLGEGLTLLGDVIPLPGAGGVLRSIGSALGLVDPSPADIQRALDSDPDAWTKLREFEMNHQLELERIQMQDRQSARDREARIVEATGSKDVHLYIMAWTMVVGFFALLCILFFVQVPDTARDLINLAVGALLSSFTAVISYFFGSSKGSADKTRMLGGNK